MACDGVVLRNPITGEETCIPIYVEERHFGREPDPRLEIGPDWWRDAAILSQIATLSGQLKTDQLRTSLTESLDVARAGLQTVLPDGIQLGQQFAQVASAS